MGALLSTRKDTSLMTALVVDFESALREIPAIDLGGAVGGMGKGTIWYSP